MNKTLYRIASLIMVLTMILGNTIHAKAAGTAYYVSPTGNDSNPGTSAAPFKTFAKATSVLSAGSTLYIYAGVYNQQLKLAKSGTSSAGITVKPTGGAVVIDMGNAAASGLDVRASYITVSGLEVKNSNDVCVNLLGSNITIDAIIVNGCSNHGIQANNSSNVKILNSRVFRTVLSNSARAMSSGWGSAIKVRISDNVLIQGNTVYNNYGEGMGTRGTNVTIRGNIVYDNYSVNIYTNSENALIERNFVYCTPNSGYERSGLPAAGISMGEEYFDGWGARLKNARVINNIVAFCKHGVRYNGAESGVVGGGLKNATIAYNTLYGSINSALSIAYAEAQTGSLITNNIIWQSQNKLSSVDNPSGLTFKNNLWKVAPPTSLSGPGDRIGEPKFSSTPNYTPESYRPATTSPAAAGAVDISIPNDFFVKTRGPLFDIGAIQFSSATTGPIPANTATAVQPTNTTVAPAATAVVPTATFTSVPPTVANTSVPPTMATTSVPPTVDTTSIPPTAATTAIPPTATFTSTPAPPTAAPTQAPTQSSTGTRYDNKHAAFVYSENWVQESSSYAIEGSFARTSANGASVTFQFTGQSFSLIYKGGPSYRKMDVYIDGALVATIDQRLDASKYKVRWDYPGQLPAGPHTLKLVFVTTGSSTNGSVDAVIVR